MMRTLKQWLCACVILPLAMPAALFAQEAATPAAVPAPAAPADPTAVLKVIPADATAFIAVRNLREVDADLNGVMQQLGVPPGIIPGPLDLLRQKLGLTKGLDENSGLALVVLNLADVKTPEAIVEKVAVLIPAANPDEMLKALGGEKDGDLTRVNLVGQNSVAASKGGFVVVAQGPDAVKAILGAKGGGVMSTLSPDRLKAYGEQDIFAWANPRGVSKELRQEVQDGLTKLMSMGMASAGAGATATQPNAGMEQLNQVLDDAQEFSLAISLDQKKGLILGWYARMREGTKTAKQSAAMKGSDKSLLIGLPNEATVFAFGAVGAGATPEGQQQIQQGLDKAFELYAQMLAGKIDAEKLSSLKEPLAKLAGTIEGMSMAISGLPPEGGEGLIAVEMVAQVKSAKDWKAQAKQIFGQLKEMIVDVSVKEGAPEDKVKAVASAVQWKDDAEQVSGAQVDHFLVDLEKLPEFEEGKSNKETIDEVKTVIGREGILIRVAAVGDKHVLVTFGGGAKRFATVAGTVQKNESPLGENKDILKVADRLPKGPRVMEGYLSLAHLLALVSNIATEVGQPLPIPMMRDATPIAFTSVKIGDAAQNTEILVPMEVVLSVKEAIGPMLGMLMGGGMNQPEEPEPAPAPGGELN